MNDPIPFVELFRSFPVPAARVWRCLVEPELLCRWWGPPGVVCEVERWSPGQNATWRVVMHTPDGSDLGLRGRFVEVVPPRRLVLTWDWEHSDHPPSQVTMTVEGDDRVGHLTIRHDGLQTQDNRDGHREGWMGSFEKLEALLSEAPT